MLTGASPLTVLNVGQNYHVAGGSDRYLLQLGELLEGHGHQVIPFASRHPRNLATPWDRYFPVGADFAKPGPRDLLRYIRSGPARRAMRRLLAEQRVDLAHLHIYYGKLTASILGPLAEAGVPIIQTLHDFKLICPVYSLVSRGEICEACEGRHYWRALPRRCNRGSLARTALSVAESYVSRAAGSWSAVTRFIAVCEFQRSKLVEHGLDPARITTIYNFVDAAGTTPASAPGRHFLYFGRLERGKGVHTLLSAAARLRTPLLLAGAGTERHALEERIRRERLSHVRLVGFKSGTELEGLVRDSICTFLPVHWYENCPLAVLESLAMGRPVIGSTLGGIPELIRDGVDGFLIPPGDVEALAARMAELADDPARAVEMGQAGRARMLEAFTPERHYAQVREVYRSVLGREVA